MVYSKAIQKIPDAAWTQLKLDTVVKDPGSNVSAVNGNYTAPSEGYYSVQAQVEMQLAGGTETYVVSVWVNGTEKQRGYRPGNVATAGLIAIQVSGIVFLKAADKVDVRVFQHNGVAKEQSTTESFGQNNNMSIVRVA